jgi:hypothetical protein
MQLMAQLKAFAGVEQAYSETHLNLIEKILEDRDLGLSTLVQVMDHLRVGRMGSDKFIGHCLDQIKGKLTDLNASDLVPLTMVLKASLKAS